MQEWGGKERGARRLGNLFCFFGFGFWVGFGYGAYIRRGVAVANFFFSFHYYFDFWNFEF